MQERRNQSFAFESEKDLVRFFVGLLPEKEVIDCLNSLRENFTPRAGVDKKTTKLEFLKKCECELVRKLKESQE